MKRNRLIHFISFPISIIWTHLLYKEINKLGETKNAIMACNFLYSALSMAGALLIAYFRELKINYQIYYEKLAVLTVRSKTEQIMSVHWKSSSTYSLEIST